MPDSTHESDDIESYWADVRPASPVSSAHPTTPVIPTEWDQALDYLSDQMLTARTTVTLRRDVLCLAIQAGLNPGEVPEALWEGDAELQTYRRHAQRIGYVLPPTTSTVLGRALLAVALRLQSRGDKPEAAIALEELRWRR